MGGGLVALVKYGKNAEYRENIIKCDNDFEKIIKFAL